MTTKWHLDEGALKTALEHIPERGLVKGNEMTVFTLTWHTRLNYLLNIMSKTLRVTGKSEKDTYICVCVCVYNE